MQAEYVIKEQNMMDAFAMVESYCHVLMERSTLLDNQRYSSSSTPCATPCSHKSKGTALFPLFSL